jgi:hypothetical protein
MEGNMKMSMYVRKQLEEALGPDNRWFCSQHHGRKVTEPDLLVEYYIKHGGAEHFRRKFEKRFESAPRRSD